MSKRGNVLDKFKVILDLIDRGETVDKNDIYYRIRDEGIFRFLDDLSGDSEKKYPLTKSRFDNDLSDEIIGFEDDKGFFSIYENGLISLSYLLLEINMKYMREFH